jgi:hypothetical protein
MSVRDTLKAILSKQISVEEALVKSSPEEREDIEIALAYMSEMRKSCHETYKTDKNGQWKIEKAFDSGSYLSNAAAGKKQNTIDYSKDVNPKPDYASIEANAPTLDYSKMTSPKPKTSPQSKKDVWLKVNAERQKKVGTGMAKSGVLLDEELKNKERMTAKNDMLGYGPAGSPESAMTMSEKEKIEGSEEHETAEKKKAKEIKRKAEEILSIHD